MTVTRRIAQNSRCLVPFIVTYYILNEPCMFLGLFHKAILQSGSPLCLWAVLPPGLAERRAKAVATIAGCPSESKEMIDCLRRLPAATFVQLQRNFFVSHIYCCFSMVELCRHLFN